MEYIQKDLRKNHRHLYELLLSLNKTDEKPLDIGYLPGKKENYLLSIVSDLTQRSFVMVKYEDEIEFFSEEEDEEGEERNIKTVEILSFSTNTLPVNNVIDIISTIMSEYSKDNQIMVMIRRNDSGNIFNEHLRRLYRDEDNIRLFPTAKYSESGEIVIDKIGHGWKQTKQDEELCQNCMKDSLVCKYFLLSSDRSQDCFEVLKYKDPQEKDSKDRFWLAWGMIAFVRHNKLNIFYEDDFDPLQHEEDKFERMVAGQSY